MNRADIIRLAFGLDDRSVNALALALGWPTTHDKHWPRTRWQNPFRNGRDYHGAHATIAYALADLGLMVNGQKGAAVVLDGDPHYRVTDLGVAVARVALFAERDARRIGGAS